MVGIAGFIGYWENCATVFTESVSINEVLGIEPEPSSESSFSSLSVVVPDNDGFRVQYSSIPKVPPVFDVILMDELARLGIFFESDGGVVDSSQFDLASFPSPLNIGLERCIEQTSLNMLSVEITVTNLDVVSAFDLVIDDSGSFRCYPYVEVLGNSVQEVNRLGPGECYLFRYDVQFDNHGVYLLDPFSLSYSNDDSVFSCNSKSTSVLVDRPSSVDNLRDSASYLLNSNDMMSDQLPSNVSMGIQLGTYSLVLLSVVRSVLNLRKWILS
jgi:hypothetical protein